MVASLRLEVGVGVHVLLMMGGFVGLSLSVLKMAGPLGLPLSPYPLLRFGVLSGGILKSVRGRKAGQDGPGVWWSDGIWSWWSFLVVLPKAWRNSRPWPWDEAGGVRGSEELEELEEKEESDEEDEADEGGLPESSLLEVKGLSDMLGFLCT